MFKSNKLNSTNKAMMAMVNPIDKANSLVTSATNMFKSAIAQVDSANRILADHQTDKEVEMEILMEQAAEARRASEEAKIAISKNNELKSKLSQFVV